jgi:hypothetical protein
VVDRQRLLVDVYGMESDDSPVSKVRIKRNARSSALAQTALIEGADHWYHDREDAVAQAIVAWLGKLS